MEKKTKNIIAIVVLLIIILSLQTFGMFGRTTFPQDMAIVYEGGYRLTMNQLPYHDFYMPIGPVVFYMQSFFNDLLGSNILSMLIHSFVLSAILCTTFYLIVRKGFGIIMSIIFSIFMYISFQGLYFHPFYNFTPYFFLFLNIFLLFYFRKKEMLPRYVFLFSAGLSTLSFYTKQDTGLLQIFLIFTYLILNYNKQLKSILLYYIIPATSFIIVIYGFLYTKTEFGYWFNLGQFPHQTRLLNLFNPENILIILSSWQFYLILIFLILLILNKIKKLESKRVAGLFLVVSITSLINNAISGSSRQTLAMGIPLIIFFIYIISKEHLTTTKTIRNITIILLLILLINPFPTYGLLTLNYMNPNLGRIQEGCYTGLLMSNHDLQGLQTIKSIIGQNNNSFVSLTEYSFLYCDYNKEPPKHLPIWFDHGITFFDENVGRIARVVEINNPNVILLQNSHGHDNPEIHNIFEDIFIRKGYIKERVIYGSTTGEVLTKKPITILIKNKSITMDNI